MTTRKDPVVATRISTIERQALSVAAAVRGLRPSELIAMALESYVQEGLDIIGKKNQHPSQRRTKGSNELINVTAV